MLPHAIANVFTVFSKSTRNNASGVCLVVTNRIDSIAILTIEACPNLSSASAAATDSYTCYMQSVTEQTRTCIAYKLIGVARNLSCRALLWHEGPKFEADASEPS